MKSIALILAGGKGSRLSTSIEKQFITVNGYTILEHTLKKFSKSFSRRNLLIVLPHKEINMKNSKIYMRYTNHELIPNGSTRKESVKNAIKYINNLKDKPENLLIHDAARPNVSNILIAKIKSTIHKKDINYVIPYLTIDSTLKKYVKHKIVTLNRNDYITTQTPQAFKYDIISKFYFKKDTITDDAQLIEIYKVKNGTYIKGDSRNFKITNKIDLDLFKKINTNNTIFRVGNGFDVHRLVKGDGIMLGGIKIKSDKKLAGHSDGDVILHALCDSLLGAMSKQDIGTYFPSSDKRLKNAPSSIFITEIMKKISKSNYLISNVDITIICQSPSLKNHKDKIKKNIMKLTKLRNNQLNIKAKTTDYLGLIGNSKAVSCWITSTLKI
ncbi:2-C-methyl-D-erythritol 2,4-cyclodiphosphate synthase [Pelagibacteraceae bacterium]|nr:2-C-methyl-D-erythritol 2,4-cyclodiphosphate synthase [Pelagibacteraceae bacterium]